MKLSSKNLSNKTKNKLFELRAKLTELLFWIFLIAMWFAMLGPMIRSMDIGIHLINHIQFSLMFLFVFAFLIRNRLKQKVKALIILFTLFFLGTGGLLSFGLYSQGTLFLLLFVLLSSIILEAQAGFHAMGLAIFMISLCGYLFINNIIEVDDSVIEATHKFSGWFMAVLIFSLISILVIVFWQQVLKFLINKIDKSHQQEEKVAQINKLLTKEIDSRKRTEYLLQKQFEESKELNKKYEEINIELKEAFHNLKNTNYLLKDAKERAQSADQLKSSFLSNMSHEVRTPLNAIVGFSSLLSNENITKEEYNNYLNVIQTSTNNLLSTISDIVNMAKIEAGDFTLYPEIINLNELIDTVISKVKDSYLENKNYQTQLVLNNEIPLSTHVMADSESLYWIILKIIDNAFKFTPNGTVNITFNLMPDGAFSLIVQDTGIGISQEAKNKIFDTFRQLDSRNTRKYGGTGLGLSIAKGLINILNGTIEFYSEPGIGSKFMVTVPLTIKDKFNSKNKNDWSGKTVLIIGKKTRENIDLNKILQSSSAILKYVETSFQAVDTINQHPEIDVAIVDCNISEMKAEKVHKVIKQIRPLLPIVGFNSNADINSSKTELWDGYFYHPIDKNLFIRIMENYLGKLNTQ